MTLMMTSSWPERHEKTLSSLADTLRRRHGMGGSEATLLVSDMVRFLTLAATAGEPLAPSRRIDKAWHEFLELNDAYATFCREALGRHVCHVPRVSNPGERALCGSDCSSGGEAPTGAARSVEETIGRTLDLARKSFGNLSENWNYDRR